MSDAEISQSPQQKRLPLSVRLPAALTNIGVTAAARERECLLLHVGGFPRHCLIPGEFVDSVDRSEKKRSRDHGQLSLVF